MRKKRSLLGTVVLTAALAAAGCSGTPSGSQAADSAKNQADTGGNSGSRDSGSEDTSKAAGADRNISYTLILTTQDMAAAKTFEEPGMKGRFQGLYPSVGIDIEEFNAEPGYFSSMKIRSSAFGLLDLTFHKSDGMNQYSRYLADLTDIEANRNNQIASECAVDGKALGIPDRKASDYVYYWADMFGEAGVEVPETRDKFVKASEKLQEHFGPQNPDFGAVCMGAKDAWPTYPLVECSPAAQSENSYYWDAITAKDAPSTRGTDIHTVYGKICDLFQKGMLGKDPLDITYDQNRAFFARKKETMTPNNPMFLIAYKADGYDTAGMSTFYLPFRDSSQNEFDLVTQGNCFLTVTNNPKNPEIARAFLEFYFSETWYPDYIASISSDSAMTPYAKKLDLVLQTTSELQPEIKFVAYRAGGSGFINMISKTKFDYKQLGVEMLTDGSDYARRCKELNQTWVEVRTKLDLK